MKILVQMDKLQNTYFHPMNQKKKSVQKFNSVNLIMNSYGNKNYTNSNTAGNEYQNSNTKTHISHDDYFIHSHSVKRIAPIVEIDPNSLQFSPSPSRDQNKLLSNQKSRENKKNKFGFTNNFKDIKIFKKNENKENLRINNNIDNLDLTQFRIFGKNSNILGVNKWINLNKLIKYEQSGTVNYSSVNGWLLSNRNFDNN